MTSENRGDSRSRTLKAASISFDGGAIDCTVRNISVTGAALDVASPVGIPQEFFLVVPIDSLRRRCRVVWRKEKRIGVAFE
ncbi:MAG: PilZ domain-containing protein [Tardiphaga sp.]